MEIKTLNIGKKNKANLLFKIITAPHDGTSAPI